MLECRLCLKIGPSIYVFDELKRLPEKIWNCCGLMIKQNDDLPAHICFSCESKLNSFIEFKQTCVYNDTVLKKRRELVAESNLCIDIYDRTDVSHTPEIVQDDDEKYPINNESPSQGSEIDWLKYPSKDFSKDPFSPEKPEKNFLCTTKKHNCNECGKWLSSLSSLKSHVYRIHKNRKYTNFKSITDRTMKCETKNYNITDTSSLVSENSFLNMKSEKIEIEIDINESFKLDEMNLYNSMEMPTDEMKNFSNISTKHSLHEDKAPLKLDISTKSCTLNKKGTKNDFSCNVCRKIFDSEITRKTHIKETHQKKALECDVCHKNFSIKRSLRVHLQRHMNLLKKCHCDKCDYSTEYKNNLNRHIGRKHFQNTVDLQCNICRKLFKTKYIRDRHIKLIHEEKSQFKQLVKPSLKCDQCDYITDRNSRLSQHVANLHTNIVDYQFKKRVKPSLKCDQCNYTTDRNNRLRQHVANRHTNITDYECNICGKIFIRKNVRDKHIKQVHELEIKSYECDICQKVFKSKTNISQHLKRHMNLVKKIPCNTCDFIAENNYQLRMHTESRHLNIKNVLCNICGKMFHAIRDYKAHAKVHENIFQYQCDYCGKGFKHKLSIRMHISIHLGIKRYMCPYCSKRFYDSSTLKTHILQHTGENPFSCDFCQRGFKQRSNLKSHMRHFHKQT